MARVGIGFVVSMVALGAFANPPMPDYPKIEPGPWFEVDADWPQKPDEFTWAAMPGVTVDKEDNVWLFTREVPSVQVYGPDGAYLFGWGETRGAHHIEIDREGYVWTTDIAAHIVQKHKRDGTVLLSLGTEGEAGEDETHFFKPTDVAVASNGDILVSDGYGNARVVHFKADGSYVKAWGSLGAEDGKFSIPHAIAIDSRDRIYVADRNNARIQVYNMDGDLIDSWKHLLIPWGFWITEDDTIWVCGSSPMPWQRTGEDAYAMLGIPPDDQVVMAFDTEGKLLQYFAFPKATDGEEQPGELNWVHCIALDSKGNTYLGDIKGKRLQKFVLKR